MQLGPPSLPRFRTVAARGMLCMLPAIPRYLPPTLNCSCPPQAPLICLPASWVQGSGPFFKTPVTRATRVWGLNYPYICIYIYTHTYMQALQNKSKNIIFENRLSVQLWVDIDRVQASQKKTMLFLGLPISLTIFIRNDTAQTLYY